MRRTAGSFLGGLAVTTLNAHGANVCGEAHEPREDRVIQRDPCLKLPLKAEQVRFECAFE